MRNQFRELAALLRPFCFPTARMSFPSYNARSRLTSGEVLLLLAVTRALGHRVRLGRRARLVDVNRELRATDHPQEPASRLVLRETPTGKLASEPQALPPLTSAALRVMPHHATDLHSGRRRFPLPELGTDLPVLHADLHVSHSGQPGLRSETPGSSTDLPGTRVPRSGQHVPPPRWQAGRAVKTGGGWKLFFTRVM